MSSRHCMSSIFASTFTFTATFQLKSGRKGFAKSLSNQKVGMYKYTSEVKSRWTFFVGNKKPAKDEKWIQ